MASAKDQAAQAAQKSAKRTRKSAEPEAQGTVRLSVFLAEFVRAFYAAAPKGEKGCPSNTECTFNGQTRSVQDLLKMGIALLAGKQGNPKSVESADWKENIVRLMGECGLVQKSVGFTVKSGPKAGKRGVMSLLYPADANPEDMPKGSVRAGVTAADLQNVKL